MAPTPPSTSSILQTISPLPFILSKSDDSARKKDPKYKRYAANIDRALVLFERVEEWADYISFLGKLLRALQSHTSQQIPYSPIIANRLAQSLHPNLPSGVHQKALELYGYIFGVLGRDEMSHELHIWVPGLLPLMSYASINVKPHLLHIMESYILPIPPESLRPILRPLLLALLPGIDDETSESFTDTLNLIDRFRSHVADDQYFWQCFFLVLLSSEDRRLGGIIYATRKFPSLSLIPNDKTKAALLESLSDELKAVVKPEPGLMVRALGKGLEDEQILVQRGFLELLVRNLQLQSGILQNLVTPYDLTLLVISASSVVLRRDMSLNRRLWTWLLGPEPSPDHSQSAATLSRSEYFRKYGLTSLVSGLKELISSVSPDPISRARPYRICLSLMDRWEVGGLVVPEVLIPIVRSVRRYKNEAQSDAHYQEVLKSASAFFDGVEAGNIWGDGFNLITTEHDLDLLLFIVRTFNVREEEMVIVHLPLILVTLFILRKQVQSFNRRIWLELANEVLEAIPARALLPTAQSEMQSFNGIETLERISQFYKRSPEEPSTPPYLPATISWILLTVTAELVTSTLNDLDPDAGDISIFAVNLLTKIPGETTWKNDGLVQALLGLTPTVHVPFKVLYGATRLLGVVIERNGMTRQEIDMSLRSFTELHWNYLSIPTGKYHVESVTSLWDLQSKCKDHRIEAAISNLVAEAYEKPEAGHAFINLWAHSVDYANFEAILTRPLLLMLDSLEDKYSPLRSISLAWLEMLGATSTSNRLYGILVSRILKLQFLRRQEYSFGEDDDLELFLYYLKTLTNILAMGPPSLCASLGTDMISVDASRSNLLQHMGLEEGDPSYRGFFIRVILRTLKYDIPPDSSSELQESLSKVLRGALQLLNVILMNPDKPVAPELAVEQALTSRLSSNLHKNDIYTQTLILDVLFRTLKVNYGDGTSENANVHQDSVIKLRDSVEIRSSVEGTSARAPTSSLIQCVIDGISTDENQPVLDSWVKFLVDCLPFFSDVLFQILIPVVECFCSQVKKTFEELKVVYCSKSSTSLPGSEGALFALMHGLEHIMVAAHDKLLDEESKATNPKTPVEPGFFGTVISGVFSVESPQARSAAANNRLTVLLCFQDCIKICHAIWLWGEEIAKGAQNDPDSASNESFMYISSRMKYRARRILERLYMTETLESLETLIDLHRTTPVFKLLHVLDGSRPKLTLPYILNAIYSRVNPVILESSAKSSLTTDIADYQLLEFQVDYVNSLENDAIEEIWMDCMAFVKDVQANVGLYRHVLPSILVFISIIGSKVDLTNFGEQRRLRKELADMFLKLLNSAVTARQISGIATPEPSALSLNEKDKYSDSDGTQTPTSVTGSMATTIAQSPQPLALQTQLSFQQLSLSSASTMQFTPVEKTEAPNPKPKFSQDELCRALARVVPSLQKVLLESDRVLAACITLGTSIITPALKSKSFPSSANAAVLEVVYQVTKIPSTEKAWKASVTDAYYDGKFFTVSESLRPKWRDILRQWLKNDKERMPDLISRVSSHSSNTNALFGWSDQESIMRRLNLRRVAFAYMCGDKDQFIMNLKETLDKLSELVSSSVCESIRSDVFLCLRAIILRTSPVHLPPFWTFIYTELQDVFSELTNSDPNNLRPENLQGVFAGCKLLDTILVLGSEEFQLHHWLFIKDTLEAAFPKAEASPLPLIDRLSLLLGVPMSTAMAVDISTVSLTERAIRRPMLVGQKLNNIAELKTFFSHLSIASFERVYTLGVADVNTLEDEIYADLFA
ncbi:Dopey, N-terminal-domain-containing protein [Lipomyces chichibuensis]|uniref:Dopey, N-terminal-domain-containing protein n=1 Tax=Lipomyces chichibuensis TaxID=1546026 RepID=UPI0033430F11